MQFLLQSSEAMIGHPSCESSARETLADGGMSRRDTSARGSDRALKRHPVDILDTYQSSRRCRAREFARS